MQLLVINAASHLCGVGEIGEIYVRSQGLAEGYLGLADIENAKKFMNNPFCPTQSPTSPPLVVDGTRVLDRGARDRVYKTGDLGRYRPDGSVECCGRSDDQVKIRGFRIELGEIDILLSQHPSIRENVTLVRRDAKEEKILVSYFVPHTQDKISLTTSHSKDIRDFLKGKLPAYSIPTRSSTFRPLIVI